MSVAVRLTTIFSALSVYASSIGVCGSQLVAPPWVGTRTDHHIVHRLSRKLEHIAQDSHLILLQLILDPKRDKRLQLGFAVRDRLVVSPK